jgi:hypothetical protein
VVDFNSRTVFVADDSEENRKPAQAKHNKYNPPAANLRRTGLTLAAPMGIVHPFPKPARDLSQVYVCAVFYFAAIFVFLS